MRTLLAESPRARSSTRLKILLSLIPGAGLNSKTVITGPGLIPVTSPSIPNSLSLAFNNRALSFNSSGFILYELVGESLSKSMGEEG